MIISVIRTLILASLIILVIRFTGKRQIGELQPSELAITIIMSNISALPIEDMETPMTFGVIPILTLACFEIIISCIGMKSKLFRSIISGRPVFIVENGKINQSALKKLRLTIDDLNENLRCSQVFNIAEVDYAIMETNGKLTVVKKFEAQNVTTEMLKLENKDVSIPLTIISDGKLIKNNLNRMNLSELWLENYLKEQNLKIENIFLMTATKNRKMFTVLKEKTK